PLPVHRRRAPDRAGHPGGAQGPLPRGGAARGGHRPGSRRRRGPRARFRGRAGRWPAEAHLPPRRPRRGARLPAAARGQRRRLRCARRGAGARGALLRHPRGEGRVSRQRAVWAIVRKDVRAIGANLQVLLPMLVVPVMLGVLLPGGLVWAILRFGGSSGELQELLQLLERVPAGSLSGALSRLDDPSAQAAFLVANYLLAPFFLLIPLMAASTISADSFAGVKERGNIESLLFSTVSVGELLLATVLAS